MNSSFTIIERDHSFNSIRNKFDTICKEEEVEECEEEIPVIQKLDLHSVKRINWSDSEEQPSTSNSLSISPRISSSDLTTQQKTSRYRGKVSPLLTPRISNRGIKVLKGRKAKKFNKDTRKYYISSLKESNISEVKEKDIQDNALKFCKIFCKNEVDKEENPIKKSIKKELDVESPRAGKLFKEIQKSTILITPILERINFVRQLIPAIIQKKQSKTQWIDEIKEIFDQILSLDSPRKKNNPDAKLLDDFLSIWDNQNNRKTIKLLTRCISNNENEVSKILANIRMWASRPYEFFKIIKNDLETMIKEEHKVYHIVYRKHTWCENSDQKNYLSYVTLRECLRCFMPNRESGLLFRNIVIQRKEWDKTQKNYKVIKNKSLESKKFNFENKSNIESQKEILISFVTMIYEMGLVRNSHSISRQVRQDSVTDCLNFQRSYEKCGLENINQERIRKEVEYFLAFANTNWTCSEEMFIEVQEKSVEKQLSKTPIDWEKVKQIISPDPKDSSYWNEHHLWDDIYRALNSEERPKKDVEKYLSTLLIPWINIIRFMSNSSILAARTWMNRKFEGIFNKPLTCIDRKKILNDRGEEEEVNKSNRSCLISIMPNNRFEVTLTWKNRVYYRIDINSDFCKTPDLHKHLAKFKVQWTVKESTDNPDKAIFQLVIPEIKILENVDINDRWKILYPIIYCTEDDEINDHFPMEKQMKYFSKTTSGRFYKIARPYFSQDL